MLYNFFFPCGSPSIFGGSPVFFWGLAWFLVRSWVWVRSCPSLAIRDPVQDLGFSLAWSWSWSVRCAVLWSVPEACA